MTKPISRKRLLNIARRMLFDGEVFYTLHTPKMTMSEYREIEELGFWIQSEWPHPPEIRMFYMMKEFDKENRNLYEKLTAAQPAAH